MAGDVASAARDEEVPKGKIFISYSRKDLAFADRLEAALKERGFQPLIDRTDIYAFADWWKSIEALIVDADTIVFVLSPDAIASEICAKEVAFAASLNKRFAPIVCRHVDEKAVPEALRRLNFIFFAEEARFGLLLGSATLVVAQGHDADMLGPLDLLAALTAVELVSVVGLVIVLAACALMR